MTKKIQKTILSIFILASIILPYTSNAAENWYWITLNRETRGKDGLTAKIPFSSKEECQKDLDSFMSGTNFYDKTIIKCIELSNEDLAKNKEAEKEALKTDEAKKEEAQKLEAQKKKERDSTYSLLAPFSNKLTEVKDGVGLGGYLNQMFFIGIGIIGALAVIMIVINGIMYMGNESVFGKTKAKERIIMAIGGLVLAIGSWVLLRTINPDLVGGSLNIKSVTIVAVGDPSELDIDIKTGNPSVCANLKKDSGSFGQGKNVQKTNAEIQTEKRTDLVDLKTLGLRVKNNSKIQKELAGRLITAIDLINTDYSITEAFKATTYAHQSKCHYFASCVDFAFRNNSNTSIKATKEQVLSGIEAFRKAGLFAQFEIGSKERFNELGITNLSENGCSNVIVVNGVAEHFSVYLKP